MIDRYANPRSDLRIQGEVEQAAAWLENMIYRAVVYREDFRLRVSSTSPSGQLWAWRNTAMREETWTGEQIAFAATTASVTSYAFRHAFQTLSPALSMRVYARTDGAYAATDWYITISAYGLVQARKNPR